MIKNIVDLESQEYQDAYYFFTNLSPSLLPEERKELLVSWLQSHFSFPDNTVNTIAVFLIEAFNMYPVETDPTDPTEQTQPTQPLQSSDTDLTDTNTETETENNIDFQHNLYLSTSDIQFIINAVKESYSHFDLYLLSLLTAHATYARANYHPNHWIRYDAKDKDTVFFLASCHKLPTKDKELLTRTLHLNYNLNMRVVGSNQPTPCFKFT